MLQIDNKMSLLLRTYLHSSIILAQGHYVARPNVARLNVAFQIVARPNVARPNVAFLVRLGVVSYI
jgi:hypothetical protein